MLSLDEAIKHAEEVAEENEHQVAMKGKVNASVCLECASEHRQLAEWLRELKAYRERDKGYQLYTSMTNGSEYADSPTIQSVTEEVNADE